jgi:predicted RNase H-like HicB family nuclease
MTGRITMEIEYQLETEQEQDGRWVAEITNVPGVMAYGETEDEAVAKAKELAKKQSEGS